MEWVRFGLDADLRRRGTGLLGYRTWSAPPEDASQPNHDIRPYCSMTRGGDTAGGKLTFAAYRTSGSNAQIATFAKSRF